MSMVEAAWRAELADGNLDTEEVQDEKPRQSSAHVGHTGQSRDVCTAAEEETVEIHGRISYHYRGSHDDRPNSGMVLMTPKASTFLG